ncbi:MAG: DUF2092 domain-containing protein [Caulobacteraceae bacterium]|nr:DUF2092 domain-containing protein [Caulobacteraceae bacterium]
MKSLRFAAAVGLGFGLALGVVPAIATFAATDPPAATPAVEPQALQALRRMSAYLNTLTRFEVTTQTSLDLVTAKGQKLQINGGARYKVRRPDGFVIDLVSDVKNRRYIYDGKQFTVFAPALGYYATAPAPATIRQTLEDIYDKYGIRLPLEDLFRWSDPNSSRSEELESGFVVGPSTIDGAAVDHYAFREHGLDWEIWIQKGDQPLPRKLVIVDPTDPAYPAYNAVLTWNVSPTIANGDFAFDPPKDAKSIRLTAANP